MEGTSFKVSWAPGNTGADIGFELETGVYKHSKAAAANKIKVEMGSSFELLRKTNKPLLISLILVATESSVIQASTKRNGKHLSIAATRDFDDSLDNTLLHPDSAAKIKTIILENVTLSSGPKPAGCTEAGTGFVCENPDPANIKPKVVIHVCKGTGCSAPGA